MKTRHGAPSANQTHLPNILGCAVGFAAAGCGVGSVVGMMLGPWLFPPLPEGVGTLDDRVQVAYGGTFLGIKVGAAVGMAAGMLYAVLTRRARLRTIRG